MRSLILLGLAWSAPLLSALPVLAQTYGQPRSVAPPPGPRLPVGSVVRRVLAPVPPSSGPADPFAVPIRTLTYIVTPEIRVRPSEVTVAPPEVHFVTPADPPPSSAPGTDTGPR